MDRVAQIREHLPDCALPPTSSSASRARPRTTSPRRSRSSTRSATTARSRSSSRRAAARGGDADGQVPHAVKRERMERLVAARAAPRDRARPALRRPHDGGPRRGPQPQRPGAPARPHPPQQDGQLRGRRARPASWSRSRSTRRHVDDPRRPRAPAQPRGLRRAAPREVLAIFGPTAVGKTGVAIEVAELLRERGEDPVAVSCDALQVYRGLEVLTAAPSAAERERLEHRLRRIRADRRGVQRRPLRRARAARDRRAARGGASPDRGRGHRPLPARRARRSRAAPAGAAESARRSRRRSPSAGRRSSTPSSTRRSPPASTRTTASGSPARSSFSAPGSTRHRGRGRALDGEAAPPDAARRPDHGPRELRRAHRRAGRRDGRRGRGGRGARAPTPRVPRAPPARRSASRSCSRATSRL